MKGGRASGKGKEGGKGGRRIPIIKRSDGVRNEGVRVSFFFFLLFLFRERETRELKLGKDWSFVACLRRDSYIYYTAGNSHSG